MRIGLVRGVTWKDIIDGNSPSFGVVITVPCVLAPPHYFLHFPSFLCALWPPACVGTMAMLPLAGFTHPHRSLAWSLAVYLHAIGKLTWLGNGTRPDIAYTAGVLACFNNCAGKAQWTAMKHLLRYIKGTLDYNFTMDPVLTLLHLPLSHMRTLVEILTPSQPLVLCFSWVVVLFPGPPNCCVALLARPLGRNSLLVNPAPGTWPASSASWRIWASTSRCLSHWAWITNQLFL